MDSVTTANGVVVRPGDRVFNYYDGKWGVIQDDIDAQGWFTHVQEDGGRHTLNGERISTREYKR